MFSFTFPIIIRSDGNPTYSMVTTLVGCVLNIILDAVFIFGSGMGIQGAAVATVISQAASTMLGLFHFWKGKPTLRLSRKTHASRHHYIEIHHKNGSVPCANQLSISVAQLIGNYALVQYGGEVYVGAMTAIRSVFQLFMMGVYGLGQGFQPIVGYNFAKKSYKRHLIL